MRNPRYCLSFLALVFLALPVALCAQSGSVNSSLYSDMRWREIGPMRAGRTRALAGVPSQPATFYLGAVNGGVWKTTDAGATWHSVWDDQPTGSIGSIAVADSATRTSSMSAAAKVWRGPIFRRRWRLQVDRRGQDVDASRDCATASRSARSRSIPKIPIASLLL